MVWQDRTTAERNYVTESIRCRRRVLIVGFTGSYSMYSHVAEADDFIRLTLY